MRRGGKRRRAKKYGSYMWETSARARMSRRLAWESILREHNVEAIIMHKICRILLRKKRLAKIAKFIAEKRSALQSRGSCINHSKASNVNSSEKRKSVFRSMYIYTYNSAKNNKILYSDIIVRKLRNQLILISLDEIDISCQSRKHSIINNWIHRKPIISRLNHTHALQL